MWKALLTIVLIGGTSQLTSLSSSATKKSLGTRVAFEPKIRRTFYPVEGQNAKELTSSMLERGPIGHGQKRFFAYTLWHFKQNQRSQKINCSISLHLPFLRPEAARSVAVKERWESFYRLLITHESNHVTNAVRACRALQTSSNSSARLTAVGKRLRARDAMYDKHSNHGRNEGVTLFVQ